MELCKTELCKREFCKIELSKTKLCKIKLCRRRKGRRRKRRGVGWPSVKIRTPYEDMGNKVKYNKDRHHPVGWEEAAVGWR